MPTTVPTALFSDKESVDTVKFAGASFMGFTVRVKVSLSDVLPSETIAVMLADPCQSATGVKVSMVLLTLAVTFSSAEVAE